MVSKNTSPMDPLDDKWPIFRKKKLQDGCLKDVSGSVKKDPKQGKDQVLLGLFYP